MKLLPDPATYNFSFMAAGLRPELARVVAEVYLAEGDWSAAKRRILTTNALQCRSASSAVRMERELRQRLVTLTREQLIILATATADDRAAVAWLAVIKHSRFAFELAVEVLRDKLESLDPLLRYSDYETFVETKAIDHPELSQLRKSSREKVRQIVLSMLADAGLVGAGTGTVTIQRPVLSPPVVAAIVADHPRWLAGFLVPDAEIRGL